MSTVKVPASTKAVETFDVELPLYRRHDTGGDNYESVHYTRIDEVDGKLRELTINLNHGFGTSQHNVEISIDTNYRFDGRCEPDYNLGQGSYALTEAEWNEAVKEAERMLGEFLKDR